MSAAEDDAKPRGSRWVVVATAVVSGVLVMVAGASVRRVYELMQIDKEVHEIRRQLDYLGHQHGVTNENLSAIVEDLDDLREYTEEVRDNTIRHDVIIDHLSAHLLDHATAPVASGWGWEIEE